MRGCDPASLRTCPRSKEAVLRPAHQCLQGKAEFPLFLSFQWQVLNKAKNRIQELERNLDTLLKLKGKRPLPGEGRLGFLMKPGEIGSHGVNRHGLKAYCVSSAMLELRLRLAPCP